MVARRYLKGSQVDLSLILFFWSKLNDVYNFDLMAYSKEHLKYITYRLKCTGIFGIYLCSNEVNFIHFSMQIGKNINSFWKYWKLLSSSEISNCCLDILSMSE